jgi:hypothetical protein
MMHSCQVFGRLGVIFLVLFEIGSAFSPDVHFRPPRVIPSCRQRQGSLLFASPKIASSTSTNVIYQKAIKPSPGLPDILFLGYLVEYLEKKFEFPARLPMIYEMVPCEEEDRCVVAWDSSLSPSSEATRMEVEVIGIYTDAKNEDDNKKPQTPTVPNMAMVVVRKAQTSSRIPPMMQNLFDDSEKKILRALDRGLEDFVAGKIQFDDSDKPAKKPRPPNVKTVEEAIQAELVDLVPQHDKFAAQDVIMDTTARLDTEIDSQTSTLLQNGKSSKPKVSKEARDAAMATMNVKATPNKNSKKEVEPAKEEVDFAVNAAKHAAVARNMPQEDFAVAAAKKIGATRKPKTKKKKKIQPTVVEEPVELNDPSPEMLKSWKAKDTTPRALKTTISLPADYLKRQKDQSIKGQAKSNTVTKSESVRSKASDGPTDVPVALTPEQSKESQRRNVNINIVNTETGDNSYDPFNMAVENAGQPPAENKLEMKKQSAESKSKPPPSQGQIERDIMEAAQDAMSELAEQGKEMTPEELLQDLLKFDEQKTRENAEGSGFVSGAFEKAKEILREQKRKREERLRVNAVREMTTEMSGMKPDILDPSEVDGSNNVRELTAEEELKRMFEAGQSIADGRITKAFRQDSTNEEGTTDEDIDALIAAEKSISGYARVLDSELAELEVRINKSPGEEFDGPARNPFFDVFSGPEVYNPNVDPETINFPGALPGTKKVRLPKELDEAVQQAVFAGDVLQKLRETESKDEFGKTVTKYFVGERELSQQQVDNLRKVALEASQIGLIADPLNVMAERSRVQMVLDELWDQPEERFRDIAESFKDLLLSESFVTLVKERLEAMADRDLDALRRDDESLKEPHARERKLLGQLVIYAQLLLKEARALGAELEAMQLEIVRSICKVAMDPAHVTEEETAQALTYVVRDMRPLLDDVFVAYLKYATAEEESRLARAGLLDDPEHNQWLFVLKIVQQGVHTEIARGINRYIDHISYVLRMETPKQRRMLLKKLIDVMPSLDVRPFVQVVDNIAASLGDSVRGEFDGVTELGEMTNKLLQLRRDANELLPPERIALMSRDADEWAARQKKRLLESRKVSEQRLKAAQHTEHLQGEIEELGRRGEIERIE